MGVKVAQVGRKVAATELPSEVTGVAWIGYGWLPDIGALPYRTMLETHRTMLETYRTIVHYPTGHWCTTLPDIA